MNFHFCPPTYRFSALVLLGLLDLVICRIQMEVDLLRIASLLLIRDFPTSVKIPTCNSSSCCTIVPLCSLLLHCFVYHLSLLPQFKCKSYCIIPYHSCDVPPSWTFRSFHSSSPTLSFLPSQSVCVVSERSKFELTCFIAVSTLHGTCLTYDIDKIYSVTNKSESIDRSLI